jgi:DNA topoisomerase-1
MAVTASDAPGTAPAVEEARQDARAAGLRYVSDSRPGIRRLRVGKSFRYVDADGGRVTDEETLARIRTLAIPPAYERVWICPDPRGHLQATGYDVRGRKQYRYHPQWRSSRDEGKFARMVEFGQALPRLRRRLKRDLAQPGLPREKVLALVVKLLDTTLARVGNDEYARSNGSYGLTTLRDRHALFPRGGRLRLRFRGKGGADHDIAIDDARLARIARRCQQLPGQALFQYLDEAGECHPVDSGQVNDYLREAMGESFTAKDFRTWGATLRAIALMGCTPVPEPSSERALTACIVAAVRQVASELRNTPAVCRKSYINPVVFEAWREGRLPPLPAAGFGRAPRKAEQAALAFLRACARRARKRGPTSPTGRRQASPKARRPRQAGATLAQSSRAAS